MPLFKRRGQHPRIEELSPDHFTFRRTCFHGFPSAPTAISYEPEFQLMAIGTKRGELRIYGRPGLEFKAVTESKCAIREIFSFSSLHQFITVSEDNTVTLWELQSEGQPTLLPTREFKLDPEGGKTITKCCLSQHSGHFYIGTEGGNIFILDVRMFQLDAEIIYWNNSTALVQPTSRSHPGMVKCLQLCPTDHNKLLIGYEKGVIVLWDLDKGLPSKNFPASIQDCQQPLESLAWQNEGQKFVSAHSDASIYFWGVGNSSASEGPTNYYGDGACLPMTKIQWLNTDASPLLVFTGGLPVDQEDEHYTVTVIQGADHVALDFTSPVNDFITVTDPVTNRGIALLVLCDQELLAFDLEAPKCPQIRRPYLFSIHASPVTCLRMYENCSLQVFEALHEISVTSPPAHEHVSMMPWPAMGGCVRASEPSTFDILLTGHENGMVNFWDVTTGAMRLIYELKTANLFVGQEPDALMDDFADFKWPPYRKVSSYDPFEDDPRLAIKFIEFCPFSRTLCVGGNGGQVIIFSLNPMPNEVRLECARAEIFIGTEIRTRVGRVGLRRDAPLECKSDLLSLPAGFQANFCLQCMPASSITALAFQPSWGLVAAGNNKGFAVANFLVKRIVLIHPTVQADGIAARSISRVQSFRRSIRSSFRRRPAVARVEGTSPTDRQQIADALNVEAGVGKSPRKPQKGVRTRASSEPASSFEHSSLGTEAAPPELAGFVTHIGFAETHISGGGASASVFACTMGSVVIRYSITLPDPDQRLAQTNRAFIAGKDYVLLHAAPLVAVFILDHDGIPIPNPYEIENRTVPPPDMHHPHYAVICTQEQLKLVTLPSMRQKRKEKITDSIHERILRAWVVRVKVAAAPVGAPRDWNPTLVLLTTAGHLLAYSLPDLRLCFHQQHFLPASDHKALNSTTVSMYGEIFHLRSFSELERSLLCSYAFSYHTTMLPSLFPFEGSTPIIQTARRSITGSLRSRQVVAEVSVEATTNGEPDGPVKQDSRDRRSATPSPEPIAGASGKLKSDAVRMSGGGVTNGVLEHAQQYLDAVGKSDVDGGAPQKAKSPPPAAPADKELIASATAFTQRQKQHRRGSASSSSSSGSSSSGSSSDSDDLPEPNEDTTFGNTFAIGLDDLGEGSKELDNIIASSLQQLESARAFYEQMQARVKKSE